MLIACCLLIATLSLAVDALAARRLNFDITVREKDPENDSLYVLIEDKLIQVQEGIKTTAFIVNFTIDLTASCDDSAYFDCNFSLFTLGPQAQTFFKKFRSQPGGIYFLENIRGKEETLYRVGVSPISVDSVEVNAEDCDFDFREDGVWDFDPSAHFDFYFIPKSLADARWNLLRDFVEINFKDFKEVFQLSFPGKINCFLSPCLLPEVVWDQRMGYAIDPPRSNLFVLYTHEHNTVDPVPAYLVKIYRFMGYAPPLLAEGMAGYFEFPHYYAQKLKETDELPPLSMILKSVDYFRLPELNNFSTASSFVKYLIDTYGFGRFTRLYRQSTDLTIIGQFSEVYGLSMDSLEIEWRHLLDTVAFSNGQFRYYYQREQYINRETGMDIFLGELKMRMDSFDDSAYVLSEEGWNLYMRGEYQKAREVYRTLLEMTPNNTAHLIVYGNLFLIDGRCDSARTIYDRLLTVDSTVKTALYKIGESYCWENKSDSAEKYLRRDFDEDKSQLSRSSSAILLGELMLTSGDTASAAYYYKQALELMEQVYQYGKTRSSFLLRLGQAHLGLAMCGESSLATAGSFLESALYFEVHPTRVIFVSRILRELGRLADLEGDRDKAIERYQTALLYPVPPGFEKQVRDYIVSPFTGYGR